MAMPLHDEEIGIEEYLQGELTSDVRHEYLAGQAYAMVGASDRHNLIAGNLFAALHPHVRGTGCQLFMADMKVRLEAPPAGTFFYYPDVMLCCDPDDRERYYRTRPCLLVEVLSDTTWRVDRREKLVTYTQIPTLRGYLLLDQDRPRAELYRCDADGTHWRWEQITEGEIPIDCLDASIPLAAVYDEVPLESP